jgi:hypothetical protein
MEINFSAAAHANEFALSPTIFSTLLIVAFHLIYSIFLGFIALGPFDPLLKILRVKRSLLKKGKKIKTFFPTRLMMRNALSER